MQSFFNISIQACLIDEKMVTSQKMRKSREFIIYKLMILKVFGTQKLDLSEVERHAINLYA